MPTPQQRMRLYVPPVAAAASAGELPKGRKSGASAAMRSTLAYQRAGSRTASATAKSCARWAATASR